MEILLYVLAGAIGGYATNWLIDGLFGFNPRQFLRTADKADIGIVLIVVKHKIGKMGVLSNFGNRYPEIEPKAAVLDALRTAVHTVKGEIAPAQPRKDS